MPSSQQVFWARVWDGRRKLTSELREQKLPGQPTWKESLFVSNYDTPSKGVDHNTIFLTSLENHDRGTVSGALVEANVYLAGQRVSEQTHRPSTFAEIEKYLDDQDSKRQIEMRKQHAAGAAAAAAAITAVTEQYGPVVAATRATPGRPGEIKASVT